MRVIIFGAGKRYQKLKCKLRKDIETVAFIDNDCQKWGSTIDDVPIVPPREIGGYTYDFIFMLSSFQDEMRRQLKEFGVSGEKIIGTDQMERIFESEPARYYGELPKKSDTEKILICSHALTSTGAQNVLYLAIQILQKKGYQLAVISKTDGILKDRILSLNVPVIIMENPHSDNNEFMKLVSWADIVLVNTVWLYYEVEELLQLGKRTIWWIHETVGFENLNDSLVEAVRKSDLLFTYAVSPLVKRRMRQRYGKSLNIRELAYGLPRYENVSKGILKREKKVFAIIGGMGWIKGQDIFIQAVENLQDFYKDKAEFWIVGAGKLEETVLQRAATYPCIKIIGEVENQKMSDLYSEIDSVVCCSREEAMSVVVTEGCMNEKPVIVSDAAGNVDYIRNGENGLVFQCGNSHQLAELMEWVIDNEETAGRLGCQGKEIYENHFTIELFEHNLLEII